MKLRYLPQQGDLLLSSLASLALRVAGLGSTFLLGVILARSLGPQGYGVYGFVVSISALAMQVGLIGTPQLAVREMAAGSARQDWVYIRTLALSFLVLTTAASIAIGAAAIAATYTLTSGGLHAAILALLGALLAATLGMGTLVSAQLRGVGLLFKGQFMDTVGRPVAALSLVALALLTGFKLTSVGALGIQVAVGTVAAMVCLVWWTRATKHNEPLPPTMTWGWLRAALPLGVVDVLRQLDGTYGVILVGLFSSASELGVFRVAVACSLLVQMPVTILHVVLAPTVSRLFRQGETAELQRLLRLASTTMCLLLIPMLLALVIVGRPLVELVFGAVYGDAWFPLTLLCGAQLAVGLYGMGPVLLAMADSERHLARIYVQAVAVGGFAALLLVPRFAGIGAATAQLLSAGTIAHLSGRFARRELGLRTTFWGGPEPLTSMR